MKDEIVVLPVEMTGYEFEAVEPRHSDLRCQGMGAATRLGI